jgi:hypothetical protein
LFGFCIACLKSRPRPSCFYCETRNAKRQKQNQSRLKTAYTGAFHHIAAKTLTMEGGGSGYSIGDMTSIGKDLPGWVTPATMSVTGVDGNGGITSVTTVTGGKFTDEVDEALGSGTTFDLYGYYYAEQEAAADALSAPTSEALAASTQRSAPHPFRDTPSATGVKVGVACGGLVGLFAVVAVLVRNSRRSAAAADVSVLTALTPATATTL